MPRRSSALLALALAVGTSTSLLTTVTPSQAAGVSPVQPPPSAQPPLAPAPPALPSLSIVRSAATVPAGQVLTLVGRLVAAGAPKAGATVTLLARTGGTTTVRAVTTYRTDATGQVRAAFRPRLSAEYRFAFAGDATTQAVRSGAVSARVQPAVSIRTDRASAGVGDPVVVTGALRPALASAAVVLQRRLSGGDWRDVAVTRSSTAGLVTLRWKAGREGYQALRLRLPAHASYTAALSPARGLTVASDLRVGARGERVVALQRRLASLKYDLGTVDGVFGSNTQHALTAFQKGQRLPRTGAYDRITREALAAPRALVVRYPAAGRAVEVDLARQILIMSEGGRVTRVIDVSTGNNEYYYSDGVRYLANTPIGRFRVERKIDGVRTARLGTLYRPAYFVQGWAIHGSSNVPTYPDSHGCVRVTNATMDRIFGLLTIGTPVAVYAR